MVERLSKYFGVELTKGLRVEVVSTESGLSKHVIGYSNYNRALHLLENGRLDITLREEDWIFIFEESTLEDFFTYMHNTHLLMSLSQMSNNLNEIMSRFKQLSWGEAYYDVARTCLGNTCVHMIDSGHTFLQYAEEVCYMLSQYSKEPVTYYHDYFMYVDSPVYLTVTFDMEGELLGIGSSAVSNISYNYGTVSVSLDIFDWYIILKEDKLNYLIGANTVDIESVIREIRCMYGYPAR